MFTEGILHTFKEYHKLIEITELQSTCLLLGNKLQCITDPYLLRLFPSHTFKYTRLWTSLNVLVIVVFANLSEHLHDTK